MKLEDLEDIAYETATSCLTTERLTREEWDSRDVSEILWEPLENEGVDFTEDVVSEVASTIIDRFKHLVDEEA